MFFLKELKKTVCSFTYILFLAVTFAFYITQFCPDTDKPLEKPVEGSENYGMTQTDNTDIIISQALERLSVETEKNLYIAYPIGFYKEVTLTDKKEKQMKQILAGLSEQYQKGELSYDTFLKEMNRVDKLIGGGSMYSDISGNFGTVPATYEDALKDYEKFVSEDKVTGAYARLFCDYLGIVLGIMPVFVAASLSERDKKSKMEQLIYSRKISSARLITGRFLALTAGMWLPVMLLAVFATFHVASIYQGFELDYFAIVGIAAVWLLPNILISTGIGMAITECYSSLLAIFVQGIWWIYSISTGKLTGGIQKFTLIIRHNNLFKQQVFMSRIQNFIFNRLFYFILSFILVAITVWIYEKKRGGGFGEKFRFQKNRVRKSKASV